MKTLATLLCLCLAGEATGQDNSGLDRLTTRDDLRGREPVSRMGIENGGFCTGARSPPIWC